MSTDPGILKRLKQFFASGYFEEPDASQMRRWSRAVRRHFEHRTVLPYAGTRLCPAGPYWEAQADNEAFVIPSYSHTYGYSEGALESLLAKATPPEKQTLEAAREHMREMRGTMHGVSGPHNVGGSGYTHSIPNYGRVLREGLNAHGRRIRQHRLIALDAGCSEKVDFYDGLLDVLQGIRVWHRHICRMLKGSGAADPVADALRLRLLDALTRVPFKPARTFYEAMVAYNFTYYLDNCDNPGRVDQELIPFYASDIEQELTNSDEAEELIRELWENADVNAGWSAAVGGTDQHDASAYNELTALCMRAARGMRRPNLQLHIRKDMPDVYWEEALNTMATGTGLPALHNEEEYLRSLRDAHLGIREADLGMYNGGGCTETMIHGCSNVGSLDAGINM